MRKYKFRGFFSILTWQTLRQMAKDLAGFVTFADIPLFARIDTLATHARLFLSAIAVTLAANH